MFKLQVTHVTGYRLHMSQVVTHIQLQAMLQLQVTHLTVTGYTFYNYRLHILQLQVTHLTVTVNRLHRCHMLYVTGYTC